MKTVIVALDFNNKNQVIQFLDKFNDMPLYVKVGMELYYQEGASIIKDIKKRGHKIFLDLKLHDIPHTVEQAMFVLAQLDVDMVNVHAAGGIQMMRSAMNGLKRGASGKPPQCIAVTQLTSTSEAMMHSEIGIQGTLIDTVIQYARHAQLAGLQGVVCSATEAPAIHQYINTTFLTITPGIRLESDNLNDQVRVTTPQLAASLGADYIVVGRSITTAVDPVETYIKIKDMFTKGTHYEK